MPLSPASNIDPTIGDDSVTVERLESQILWYEREGKKAKVFYFTLKTIVLVAGAVVAAGSAYLDKYALSFLGATVVIAEGTLSLGQFKSSWLEFRSTCEQLKRERHLYLARIGDYETGKVGLLATRMEDLIARESSVWRRRIEGESLAKKNP